MNQRRPDASPATPLSRILASSSVLNGPTVSNAVSHGGRIDAVLWDDEVSTPVPNVVREFMECPSANIQRIDGNFTFDIMEAGSQTSEATLYPNEQLGFATLYINPSGVTGSFGQPAVDTVPFSTHFSGYGTHQSQMATEQPLHLGSVNQSPLQWPEVPTDVSILVGDDPNELFDQPAAAYSINYHEPSDQAVHLVEGDPLGVEHHELTAVSSVRNVQLLRTTNSQTPVAFSPNVALPVASTSRCPRTPPKKIKRRPRKAVGNFAPSRNPVPRTLSPTNPGSNTPTLDNKKKRKKQQNKEASQRYRDNKKRQEQAKDEKLKEHEMTIEALKRQLEESNRRNKEPEEQSNQSRVCSVCGVSNRAPVAFALPTTFQIVRIGDQQPFSLQQVRPSGTGDPGFS